MWIHLHSFTFFFKLKTITILFIIIVYIFVYMMCVDGWRSKHNLVGLILSHFHMNSWACVASSFANGVIFQFSYSLSRGWMYTSPRIIANSFKVLS